MKEHRWKQAHLKKLMHEYRRSSVGTLTLLILHNQLATFPSEDRFVKLINEAIYKVHPRSLLREELREFRREVCQKWEE